MKVELHNIVAELIASQTPMACTRCGTPTSYLTLLLQLGDPAIARSLETLARIKAQRAKLKKPEPQGK